MHSWTRSRKKSWRFWRYPTDWLTTRLTDFLFNYQANAIQYVSSTINCEKSKNMTCRWWQPLSARHSCLCWNRKDGMKERNCNWSICRKHIEETGLSRLRKLYEIKISRAPDWNSEEYICQHCTGCIYFEEWNGEYDHATTDLHKWRVEVSPSMLKMKIN